MKNDRIKQYVALRDSLLKERAGLVARLDEIEKVLAAGTAAPVASAPRGGGRIRNPMSLRQAIVTVTKDRPLTKQQILDAIHKLGYRFISPHPINSLNAVLYANRKFKNAGGKFSPAR
jgi:hypothetical protein